MIDMEKLDLSQIETLVELAVAEDLGDGDPTSAIVAGSGQMATASLVARQPIVVCGMDVAEFVLKKYDDRLRLDVSIGDGQSAEAGVMIGTVAGPLAAMLSAERVVLNFLQRLCGISTMTRKYVDAVAGSGAKIYDTRKTTPGWRVLEKYAVRCGGGHNHRLGLGDGVMFKDNHVAALGDKLEAELGRMVERAHKVEKVKFVCVEVDRVKEQLESVLKVAGVDIVLLDNMSAGQLAEAVRMRDAAGGKAPLLEASGGIRLDNIAGIAATGIERISVGAITHSAAAVDIGLDEIVIG